MVCDSLGTSSCPQLQLLIQQITSNMPQVQAHHIQVHVRQLCEGLLEPAEMHTCCGSWSFTDI